MTKNEFRTSTLPVGHVTRGVTASSFLLRVQRPKVESWDKRLMNNGTALNT